MCDVERRCQYKQRVAGKCRPRETGSSQSRCQVVSVSMSELFLTWLLLWSSCSSLMVELKLLVSDQFSRQNWARTRTWSRRSRRLWTPWTHWLPSLSPLYPRQIMTNCWWVEKEWPNMLICIMMFWTFEFLVENYMFIFTLLLLSTCYAGLLCLQLHNN